MEGVQQQRLEEGQQQQQLQRREREREQGQGQVEEGIGEKVVDRDWPVPLLLVLLAVLLVVAAVGGKEQLQCIYCSSVAAGVRKQPGQRTRDDCCCYYNWLFAAVLVGVSVSIVAIASVHGLKQQRPPLIEVLVVVEFVFVVVGEEGRDWHFEGHFEGQMGAVIWQQREQRTSAAVAAVQREEWRKCRGDQRSR